MFVLEGYGPTMVATMDMGRVHWWLATWQAVGGDPLKARAIRTAGDQLVGGLLWKLVHWELSALGANTASGSELQGRLGLAVLLDLVVRTAPEELSGLAKLLLVRAEAVDYVPVGALAALTERLFAVWAQRLGVSADVEQRLAERGEITVYDARAAGDGPDARRRQAELVLAYSKATGNPAEARLGVVATGVWARDDAMRPRLVRVGGRFEPRQVLGDYLAHLVLAALRVRKALVSRGEAPPVPDARLMDTPAVAMTAALQKLAPTPAPVATPTPAPAPATALAPTPTPALAPTPAAVARDDRWWAAAIDWADPRRKLGYLLELAERFERSRLWDLLQAELSQLTFEHRARPQELAQYALALVCDEYLRAYPTRYGRLLDQLAVEPDETIRASKVGELWATFEPVFCGWARVIEPGLDPADKGKVGRILQAKGDILPWDDDAKGNKDKRRRAVDDAIDAVYQRNERDPTKVRTAVYWAATRARNDHAHNLPDSLAGHVRATELLADVVALIAIAVVRFRRWDSASVDRADVSLPSLAALPQALLRR